MDCFEQKKWNLHTDYGWDIVKEYNLGDYIYDQNYDNAMKYFKSIGNEKPSQMELVRYFYKQYPEAHPMHLMADLVGIQQLNFGYVDVEGNPNV